jgi:hypothetical protein
MGVEERKDLGGYLEERRKLKKQLELEREN